MQADEAFFKLLRLGIGTCHDRDVALDKAGWAAVYDMACKQAVAAIVLDGVERLSIIQKPPMDVVDRIGAANRNPQPQAQPDARDGV